ncbi:hypothetical protein AN618_03830 [Fervidicola ferrireducens]|uniref:DNA-binding transcriptional activator GutM n=2 Tax=Fervidicola ferrireducens TaxID=520764 RepID=A0A140LCP2_9FIRM|nr:hypothetical protein AN618_03830 [Fervidicola ferrireducens]
MTLKILGIIAILWVLQGVLTYFQVRNLQNKIRELKKKGRVGLGSSKGRFSPGSIVLIAVDDDGKIVEAYRMSGMTVFARFREFDEIKGLYLQEVSYYLSSEKSGSLKKALENALEMLKEKN